MENAESNGDNRNPGRLLERALLIVGGAICLVLLGAVALWCEGFFDDFDADTMSQVVKTFFVMIWRVALATALAATVGMERERRDKPAGARTIAMVGLGACLFALLADTLEAQGMSRILQGAITGIGFLGAGTIIKQEFHIEGLTTAASLWAVAGVGLACGTGHYLMALIGTAGIWVVLSTIRRIEIRVRKAHDLDSDEPDEPS